MYLLVPAHPGCPEQGPESRKMVVCVCVPVLSVVPVPEIKGPESVSVGESLILECIAEGYPDARVVWVPPPRSSVTEVEGRGSAILRVDRVTADDEGVYTCYIYTDVEQYQKTITVTGIYLPIHGILFIILLCYLYCISFVSCYCGSFSDHLVLLLLINLI